ncbi:hypothetical protein BY996DRAFT_6421525 [Phakopsora pachyrhizi]|nr:hypothetical protein BY996DRAFT_6421525 [Phakopsora pachyrhizi]
MTLLENNTHLSSAPFPHPTVSLLHPISSPPTFLNTNTGCITEHNEREQDDNSNGNSEHNEDEYEYEEDEDFLPLIFQFYCTYTLTESETNPIDINMEASNNPSLPSYIQGKVKEAIDLLRADEESIESNIITVKNPGIANSTQTVSNYQQANIAESKANSMQIPDTQELQSMTVVQIPSQVETLNFLTCSNISHQPTNSNASGDPNNIHSTLMVGLPDSNYTVFNSDLAINPAVTNFANTLILKVPLSVPVSCPSQFFLQHEDILSATLGSIYHLKTSSWNINLGSILALVKNRNSRIESVELPNYLPSGIEIKSDYDTSISQWLKHLDDFG